MKKLELHAAASDAGERLDRFIAHAGGISRGAARRVLEAGGVFLDKRRCKVASRLVAAGQEVTVNLEEGGRDAGALATAIEVLYTDADLVVVNKPPGVLAQPSLIGDANSLPQLVERTLSLPKLYVVHRLDRETSGITVLARTEDASAALATAFRDGMVQKLYVALTAPSPGQSSLQTQLIDAPLGPDPHRKGLRQVNASGDAAITKVKTVWVSDLDIALVEAQPRTGRTHQIRVHLAHLGAPILGDWRYGGVRRIERRDVPRVMLHAKEVRLIHPTTGAEMAWTAPVPSDFQQLLDALKPTGTDT